MGRTRSNENFCNHSFGIWPAPYPYRNYHLYFRKARWISCVVFFSLYALVSFRRIEKGKNTQLFLLFPSTNNIFYCNALQRNRYHSPGNYVALRCLLNEGKKLETLYLEVGVLCPIPHYGNTGLHPIPICLYHPSRLIKKN